MLVKWGKTILFVFMLLLLAYPVNAGFFGNMHEFRLHDYSLTESTSWFHTYGTLLGEEEGSCVNPTVDGGYIVIGTVYIPPFGAWLIKVDDKGIKEWDKLISGFTGDYVQQTTDGGYIIGCQGEHGNIWLFKVDANGNEEWRRSYGGSDDEWMRGDRLVQQTSDGGYVITGGTLSYGNKHANVWLVKTDSNGLEEWNVTYGGASGESGGSVQQTSDGGYIIAGDTYSYGLGFSDAWLIKTNEYGMEEWNVTYGTKDNNEWAFSVQQTTDGGYILVGNSFLDGWVLKADSQGVVEWNRTFDTEVCSHIYSVQQTSDDGFIMVGMSGINPWESDICLIKLSEQGDVVFSKAFGRDVNYERGFCVRQTDDGGFIVTGDIQVIPSPILKIFFFTDCFLLKTDEMGNADSTGLGAFN
jgi:hypothetical protein